MAEQDKEDIQSEVIIYQTEDGDTKIDVRFVDETVWLTQAQLVDLFQSSKANISEHIKNIYAEGELDEKSTVRKFRTVQIEGGREVARNIVYYNLDMIISLGYRVKSKIATNFRRWATERLKEYMIKGFTMDDERLKNLGGGTYWKEFAAHGHTAAEVIYERADAEKPFMGLRSFSGDFPTVKDIGIAKNYLSEKELKILNGIVSGYFENNRREFADGCWESEPYSGNGESKSGISEVYSAKPFASGRSIHADNKRDWKKSEGTVKNGGTKAPPFL